MAIFFTGLNTVLGLAAPAQPGQEPPPVWTTLMPIILMVVIFYFLLFRPQQKRAKEHARLLQSLRPGDKIVTNGGIVGTVIAVRDKTVSVRSADTKLEILKSAVTEITERSADASEN